jgi:hypothetical protein
MMAVGETFSSSTDCSDPVTHVSELLSVGGAPSTNAGMDRIADLFQMQAKRLETQLLQQLQDKRLIEQMQAQLAAMSVLVQSLESQRVIQAQTIDQNLQLAMQFYDRARTMQQQKIHLRTLIDSLRSDKRILYFAMHGAFPPAEVEAEGRAAAGAIEVAEQNLDPEAELPHLSELLPGFGTVLGRPDGKLPGSVGPAYALSAAFGGAPAAVGTGAALTTPPLSSIAPAETAMEALALLSTVASTKRAKAPCSPSGGRASSSSRGVALNATHEASIGAPALVAATATAAAGAHHKSQYYHYAPAGEWGVPTMPAAAAASTHSSLAPLPTFMEAGQGAGIGVAAEASSSNRRGSSTYRPRNPSPLAVHRPARAAGGAHAGGTGSCGGQSIHSGSSSSGVAAPAPAAPKGHTTLTEHMLTAHDGVIAAAGLTGPNPMVMWMSGAHELTTHQALMTASEAAASEHAPSRVDHTPSGRASKRARDEGGAHSNRSKTASVAAARERKGERKGHSSDSGNDQSVASSDTAMVSDGAPSGSEDKSKTPSPSSPTALDGAPERVRPTAQRQYAS